MSQNKTILKHLKEHGSITAWEAVHRYNIFRLSARILEIRDAGHDIETIMMPSRNPGSAGVFAEYRFHSR